MIYNLKFSYDKDKFITARVNSLGAELVSLKKDDNEYIWVGDKNFWGGQNPVLFPVIARLMGGKTSFSGVEYTIEKHGFARKSEFECVGLSDNKITLKLSNSPFTLECFPYQFDLLITHEISAKGFKTSYEIINKGKNNFLCNIGGHPGFNIPLSPDEKFSDYRLIFDTVENAVVYYGDENVFLREDYVFDDILKNTNEIKLDYPLFEKDALMCANLKSTSVKLVGKLGKGVKMDFSGFPVLGIWTPPDKKAPFVCLEPWHGLPSFANESGNFEDKPYLIKLKPDESKLLSFSVSIIE